MFIFYHDPGHGWLKVTYKDLEDLGFKPEDFSSCSYRKRDHMLLEEDSDALKFVKEWEKKYNRKMDVKEVYIETRSKIGI